MILEQLDRIYKNSKHSNISKDLNAPQKACRKSMTHRRRHEVYVIAHSIEVAKEKCISAAQQHSLHGRGPCSLAGEPTCGTGLFPGSGSPGCFGPTEQAQSPSLHGMEPPDGSGTPGVGEQATPVLCAELSGFSWFNAGC